MAMGKRLRLMARGSAYHGNAGIASAFAALGHRKLREGGILALVLPLTSAVGLSWNKFRQMLVQNYTDIEVLSIAANGRDMSFSSDTGMSEALVIARKSLGSEKASESIRFTSFNRRPSGFAHTAAIASAMTSTKWIRQIGDGPYGGTSLKAGDERTGEMLSGLFHGRWERVERRQNVGLITCPSRLRADNLMLVATKLFQFNGA